MLINSNNSERPGGNQWRRGASAVEFAVVASLFFMLILGIFEFSRSFMVMHLLTEAARQGARAGCIEGVTTQQIKDTAVNFLNSVGVQGDTANVIINDGVGNVVEAANVPPYTEITVLVTVPVGNVSWASWFISSNGVMSGQWTLRRE
jgi:Flp pilus assembly protein TadG